MISTTEQGTSVAIALGTNSVTTQGLTPKSSNGQNIGGIAVTLTASIQQATAQPWRVSDLFGGLQINKGSAIRMNVIGYKNLQNLFNALTRLDNTSETFFSDPQNVGAVGTSTQTMTFYLPIELSTAVIPVTVFTFNGLANVGATSGNIDAQITYYYTTRSVQDDLINIVTTPTTLAANTTIDVSQYFTFTGIINEVWADIGASDDLLKVQTFRFGSNPVYDKHTAWQIRASTNDVPFAKNISGFLRMKTNPVAFPPNGVSGAKPILDMEFTSTVQPTFMLFSKIA